MTTPADLPPEPGSAPAGYRELADVEGQMLEITAVEDLKGIPIVVAGGQRYLVVDEWGEECATKLQSLFETSNAESFTVLIKRAANGELGMVAPPAS